MEQQKIDAMETKLRFLHKKMSSIVDESFLNEMLANIKKPGWTSIAEGFLIEQLLQTLLNHTQQLHALKNAIANAASLITNPKEENALAVSNCAQAYYQLEINCAQIFSLIPATTAKARAEVNRLEQANLKLIKANPGCRLRPC